MPDCNCPNNCCTEPENMVAADSATFAFRKPKNPGKSKGKLMQAHVLRGGVVSHDLDSVLLKVDRYNGVRPPLAGTEVEVFVSATTHIVVGDTKGTIDSLVPGLPVVAVCRIQADGSFVARNITSDAPEED